MTKTITAADVFENVEVDLWGAKYRLREGTRTVATKLIEKQVALDKVNDEDADAVVDAMADILDVLLEPLGDESGKKVHAKTVLVKKWEANELGLDRITAITNGIQDAQADRGRPPSAAMNGG